VAGFKVPKVEITPEIWGVSAIRGNPCELVTRVTGIKCGWMGMMINA